MGIRDMLGLAEVAQPVDETTAALERERETTTLLQESIAELQLALEDQGWQRILAWADLEFTAEGRKRAAELCRVTAVANPLMKRGVAIRIGYIWGGGVSIQARAASDEDGGQDVNAVVQAFLDDPSNVAAFTGPEAREEKERALATDGNVFLALFTAPLTGQVQVRSIPHSEIGDIICDPEDRAAPWFYQRTYVRTVVDTARAVTREETVTVYYPAEGYWPQIRVGSINGHQVLWDAPVVHVRVNALDGWKFGMPDCYAPLAWARSYKVFLEDWAILVKALSRYAYRVSTKGSKVPGVKARIAAAPAENPISGEHLDVGGTAVFDESTHLEAVPKTGATIDSNSGRPLAAMVAAGLDVPVTMLLGDPGVAGARATAETLDQPTEHAMRLRRELWSQTFRRILNHVIDQAAKAKRGPLRGTVVRDGNRELVTLAGDVEKTVEIVWPEWDSMPVDVLVKAIAAADQTNKLPGEVIARLLLEALGVDDVDEILEEITDDDGRFIDPAVSAGQAAVDAFRRGQDPEAALAGAGVDDDQGEP